MARRDFKANPHPRVIIDAVALRATYPTLTPATAAFNTLSVTHRPAAVTAALTTAATAPLDPATTRDAVETARSAIADLVDTTPDCVALYPTAALARRALAGALAPRLQRGGLLVSAVDEPTLVNPFVAYAQRAGAPIVVAEPDVMTGSIPSWQFEQLHTPSLRLAVIQLAHPSTGTLVPVAHIADVIKNHHRAWVVADISHVVGRYPITADDSGADILICEMTNLGVEGLTAVITGSRSTYDLLVERGADNCYQPGHVTAAAAAAATAAVDHLASLARRPHLPRAQRINLALNAIDDHVSQLLAATLTELLTLPGVTVVGLSSEECQQAAASIDRTWSLSLLVDKYPADQVAQLLAEQGIAVDVLEDDLLLNRMGVDDEGGAITVTLQPYTTPTEVHALIQALKELV